MTIRLTYRSIRNAINGLSHVFRHERNFRIQLFAALCVLAAAWFFRIQQTHLLILLLVIGVILLLELMNSASEVFLDIVEPRLRERVRIVKDIMAAAVFVASVGAFLVGLVLFLPYIIAWFS